MRYLFDTDWIIDGLNGSSEIADFDLLIAATALTYDLTFVTRNVRHFERFGRLEVFRADDQ